MVIRADVFDPKENGKKKGPRLQMALNLITLLLLFSLCFTVVLMPTYKLCLLLQTHCERRGEDLRSGGRPVEGEPPCGSEREPENDHPRKNRFHSRAPEVSGKQRGGFP